MPKPYVQFHPFPTVTTMKNNRFKEAYLIVALCFLFVACSNRKETPNDHEQEKPPFEETWESLATIEREPEWFKDSKLGIYFHWGVYSVPAFDNEWYPRWMYMPDRGDQWGGKVYAHHQQTYGSIDTFNYHDFVPMFTGSQFDAEKWASLFEEAGAKFAGPVAQHHDGFAMWDSKVNPWNAADMGPKKDITGELFEALKSKGLKTIATFHHAKLGQRYANDSSNWAGNGPDVGWNSHYPYHPDYITSSTDPKFRKLYGNLGEKEFNDYWLDQVKEVVDQYAPDILWYDSWLDMIPENYRQKMVAHHFNVATSRNQSPLVFHKQEDLPEAVSLLDIEQGGKTEISDDYWMTDITISHGSWCYTEGQTYKDATLIIRNMIDVWSKRGIVLLNISPTADGVINEEQRNVLQTIGRWIAKHKEAVYETRAYDIFGYGDAAFEKGEFGGQSATMSYNQNDYRFTRSKDGKSIFVYALGLPKSNATLEVKHILGVVDSKSINGVSIVGSNMSLEWSAKNGILVLHTPGSESMDEIATVFKIELE